MGRVEAIETIGVIASSDAADWSIAGDYHEDAGGCPVMAAAMRAGIYRGHGYGGGYGDGYGDGSGDGDGSG